MTVPAAIAVHRRIGGQATQRHPQALRSYWVERVRDIRGIELLTPDKPARYGAVTSFRLPAMKDYAQAQRLASVLLGKHKVLTVASSGPSGRRAPRSCDGRAARQGAGAAAGAAAGAEGGWKPVRDASLSVGMVSSVRTPLMTHVG